MDVVIVVNRNSRVFSDAFCGIRYTFPPNQETPIPKAAATHIFGYGETNRIPHLVRLGKANDPAGATWLEQFVIVEARAELAQPVKDPEMADLVRVINGNEAPLTDGFSGRFWTFRKGSPVDIPVPAARHIFGYGMPGSEDAVLRRLGWRDKGGLSRLKQFRLEPVRSQFAPETTRAA